VDDVFLAQELERLKNLNGKAAYERERNALEVVILYELVQVDREELERDDQVVSEHAVVFYLNNVVLVFRVLALQVLQNAQFYTCLVLVPLLVFYNFDRHNFASFMVETL